MQAGMSVDVRNVSIITSFCPGSRATARPMASPCRSRFRSAARVGKIPRWLIVTTVMSGCRSPRIRITSSRQAAHSVYSRLSVRCSTGMSMNGHDSFTNGSSRQPRSTASRSNAGNHWPACESPTSAIVNSPAGSPYTQSGGLITATCATQPSRKRASVSLRASASEGLTSAGRGSGSARSRSGIWSQARRRGRRFGRSGRDWMTPVGVSDWSSTRRGQRRRRRARTGRRNDGRGRGRWPGRGSRDLVDDSEAADGHAAGQDDHDADRGEPDLDDPRAGPSWRTVPGGTAPR